MDWNSYFALRGTRRLYERVFMVPSTLLGLLGGGYYFAHQDFDPTISIFGMDQVLLYGLGTVGVGLVGLAVGPVVGNVIFRAVHANARPLLDKVEKMNGYIRLLIFFFFRFCPFFSYLVGWMMTWTGS